ncbi:hypothetical protein SISSUDRAFT_1051509 [Sistotremastrum suecicum HHB10207 ss-3]|uniref:UBA domain-containing protein n=1 Tax=Sistotremastrum suecicum HHB10207 ss-3 TaxID=1314776 RepID=A0A166AI61_9AGAM|nr:hypothetical protein SISSUDRAFT_1051509 [Sistotremastrum suecicum HHB10207 ss-3]
MADSFADLWNASAPPTSNPSSSSKPPLTQQKLTQQPPHKKYDAFSILASSGSNTPRSITPGTGAGASRPSPPPAVQSQRSGDAFNDLLSFGSGSGTTTTTTSPNRNLSLADRQAKLSKVALPTVTVQGSNKASDAFWDQFGDSGAGAGAQGSVGGSQQEDEWDLNLLSAKPAPLRSSSASPSPSPSPLRQPAPSIAQPTSSDPFDFDSLVSSTPEPKASSRGGGDSLLDDTFGGNQFGGGNGNENGGDDDGDDILGLLAKPVSQSRRTPSPSPSPHTLPIPSSQNQGRTPSPQSQSQAPARKTATRPISRAASPPPHIIGQIVEMGYSPSQARVALAATESGVDVQGALEILLAQAGSGGPTGERERDPEPERERGSERYGDGDSDSEEERRRQRQKARRQGPSRSSVDPSNPPSHSLRQQNSSQSQTQSTTGTGNLTDLLPPELSVQADKLLSQATELGKGMFNRAGAFWRDGRQKAMKAYEERARTPGDHPNSGYGREGNGNGNGGGGGKRPAWMSGDGDDHDHDDRGGGGGGGGGFKDDSSSDDERSRPESIQSSASASMTRLPSNSSSRPPLREPPPNVSRSPAPPSASTPVPGPSVYKSSLRRGPTPAARQASSSSQLQSTSQTRPSQPILPPSSSSSKPTRPPIFATPSQISQSTSHILTALSQSTQGAYSSASESYTKALAALPEGHVLSVEVLIGRAKARGGCGESRGVVEDCSLVLGMIKEGISASEWASLPALSASPGAAKRRWDTVESEVRKLRAMAYEQMEKWRDAKEDWEKIAGMNVPLQVDEGTRKEAISGAGRCRKILAPPPPSGPSSGPSTSSASKPRPTPKPKPANLSSKAPSTSSQPQKPSEAVARLRAAASQAESESNLASSLKDTVDARLASWRGGKQQNLRALLASLDLVLWDEVGWKKVGMHELVTEGQVKKVYVRAIAKVHPDKLSVGNSTVEQRMIANDVFGTLNEAWIAMQG